MPYAISHRVQSLPQRLLRYSSGSVLVEGLHPVRRVHFVLRLRKPALCKPMARQRVQELQGFQSRSSARVRHTGRNRTGAKPRTGNAVSVVGSPWIREQREEGECNVNQVWATRLTASCWIAWSLPKPGSHSTSGSRRNQVIWRFA